VEAINGTASTAVSENCMYCDFKMPLIYYNVETTEHEMIPVVWEGVSARCGGLLAIGGTTCLLLVGATDRYSTSHRLNTPRISINV